MTATHDPSRGATDPHAGQHPSADDPRVWLDEQIGVFEPIPPYPPRTEREAEFYTLGDGEMFINIGPQHPSTHGVLRVVLKIDGERVVDLDPVLGYLHRGVEKLCENADYHQAICYTDPLEYVSSLFMEWAPVMAFEKLLDVQVPRRAEYIRVLTGELNRIASHIMFVGWMALDLGGLTPILWCFIERDEIVEMLAAHHRPADAVQLLPDRRRQRRPEPRVPEPPRALDEPRDEPARRGAGAPQRERDLRPPDARPGRHRPRDRPPDVPDRPEPAGDRASRSTSAGRTRTASTRTSSSTSRPAPRATAWPATCCAWTRSSQSLRIIDQCLHEMPDGPVLAKLPRLLRPRPGRAYAAVEGPRSRMLRGVAQSLVRQDVEAGRLVELAVQVERRVVEILAELKPGRELHTNVEFYAGVVMALCGLPREMFTPTFAVARAIGWSANVLEQAADPRIIRPSARYVGPPPPQPVPAR